MKKPNPEREPHMDNRRWLIPALLVFALLTVSCTAYKSQEVPFRHPSAYPNMQMVAGAQVAAEAYVDPEKAKEVFGFNIRSAGLLPVQVVIDNTGPHDLEVVADQTFLIDDQGNMWNLLDRGTAYQRVENSSEFATIAKGAGKGTVLGAAGGAIVGAAIGILTGNNVGEALGKGAAVGAAGGAVIGGTQAGTSDEPGRQISQDLAHKELQNKNIQPGNLGRGFLFFPGEAPSASMLRLQLKETGTGEVKTVLLSLR
jgi:hypothetical protein